MTDLLVDPKLDEPDTGSSDDHSHYAKKADIARAAVMGGKIKALCGVEFEPLRDPERYPVCEECKRLLEMFGNMGNN